MALYPPRTAGTDSFDPHLQQRRLGGRRLRQRHALRRLADRRSETGKDKLTFEVDGRVLQHLEGRRRAVHRRHGRAALRLERDSARRGIPRHPRDRVADRPDRQADPAFAVGRSAWATRTRSSGSTTSTPTISPGSGRCWSTIRSFRSAPTSRCAQVKSREHIVIRTWERGAGLTKACGSAACAAAVAAARLKRTGRKVTRDAAGRRSHHRMARERRSRADDRPGRVRVRGPLRSGAVRQGEARA